MSRSPRQLDKEIAETMSVPKRTTRARSPYPTTPAYYLDDNNVIRSTAQPAAPGFTHRLVGNVVQVIADDGEIAFEYQAWFDRAALEAVIM